MSHLLLLLLLLFCKWTSANQSNPSKLHLPQGNDSWEDPSRNMSKNIAGLNSLELMAKMEDMTAKIKSMEEMLEKREEDNWFIRFIAWPVERPWNHVHGSDNVDKYKAQWKLGDTYYQATVVLREEKS